MARIELRGVAHSYMAQPASDDDFAVRTTDITWADGGAYALLGPSGSGKTTLLNILSGLLHPTRGRILFDGDEVTERAPQQRNVAQVFQFPVIYDTMTVFDNLAFPLRNRGMADDAVRRRVAEVAEMLELASELHRRARGLSPDAKQKISLGRGLVREDVAAILFDEPLTVIDPHLKWLLRRKLKEIHERLGVTMIYVTHDQNEALTFADDVVVLHEGRVVQQGTPQELFERPQAAFVGYFIGTPGMNLLACVVENGAAVVDGARIPLPAETAARASAAQGELTLGIRPDFVGLAEPGAEGAVEVTVTGVEELGNYKIVTATLGATELKIRAPDSAVLAVRETRWVVFPPAHTKLFADGMAIH